jgi:hypothetical protein
MADDMFLNDCNSLMLLSMVIVGTLTAIFEEMEVGGHWFDPSRE